MEYSSTPPLKGSVPHAPQINRQFCILPVVPERSLGREVTPERARLIRMFSSKWVNGTVLHYYFFDKETDGANVRMSDGTLKWKTWAGNDTEKNVVRKAFKVWKDLGIGISFAEVGSRDEAEIRIGFMNGDGAWSFVGRDVLNQGREERTMNFGWDITSQNEFDTPLHEIGHTLGFPHEHQNPNAGIVWDEEAVYAALAAPPNEWSRDETYHNIIRKIPAYQVRGSSWDPNSVMEYPFGPGLIKEPEQYRTGITPAGGLSAFDKEYVLTFYPALPEQDQELNLLESVRLNILPGQQVNFRIRPTATRDYTIETLGVSDTVIVLFENVNGELRYRIADDDSGEDRNARLRAKLFVGREYVLRLRLYYQDRQGETAVVLS